MITTSNGNIFALSALCEGNRRPQVGSPHKGKGRGALVYTWICTWTNSWANNRDVGDLRCPCANYDVTVMLSMFSKCFPLMSRTLYSVVQNVSIEIARVVKFTPSKRNLRSALQRRYGAGASLLDSGSAFVWNFNQMITVHVSSVRKHRLGFHIILLL